MSNFYDEIEIEDMDFSEEDGLYYYPCPCGDRFEISKEDLRNGEEVARCPSCSLIIRVIFDQEDFADSESESGEPNAADTGTTSSAALETTPEITAF